MNPRTKQNIKVEQPNVQPLDGLGARSENGRLPSRVVAVGKNPSVIHRPVHTVRTDHWRKNIQSDEFTK